MAIIAKYKFDSSIDTLPSFNSGFVYTYTDENNNDRTITRTIESSSSPTSISFSGRLGLLELHTLDISNLSNFSQMFYNCNNLSYLNTSNWNTINITDMSDMFFYCTSLTLLDLSHWNISNVTTLAGMFNGCQNLISIKLNGWDISKCSQIQFMFYGCKKLEEIDLSYWDVSKITSVNSLFYNCENLSILNLTGWKLNSIELTENMFVNCSDMMTIILSNSNSDTINSILEEIPADEYENRTIEIVSIDIDTTQIFPPSDLVDSITIRNYNTFVKYKFNKDIDTLPIINDGDAEYYIEDIDNGDNTITRTIKSATDVLNNISFKNCEGLLEIYDIDFTYLNSLKEIFYNCSNLYNVNISNWLITNVTDTSYMFYNCTGLTSLDLTNWYNDKTTDMTYMFYGCNNLEEIDVSNWNVINVIEMQYMFAYCNKLKTLNAGNWNTNNVLRTDLMFAHCLELESLDLSNWDMSNVLYMNQMFDGCIKLKDLNLNNWIINDEAYLLDMLFSCNELNNIKINNSDYNSVNNIIAQLPTRTAASSGELYTLNCKPNETMPVVYDVTLSNKATLQNTAHFFGGDFPNGLEIPVTDMANASDNDLNTFAYEDLHHYETGCYLNVDLPKFENEFGSYSADTKVKSIILKPAISFYANPAYSYMNYYVINIKRSEDDLHFAAFYVYRDGFIESNGLSMQQLTPSIDLLTPTLNKLKQTDPNANITLGNINEVLGKVIKIQQSPTRGDDTGKLTYPYNGSWDVIPMPNSDVTVANVSDSDNINARALNIVVVNQIHDLEVVVELEVTEQPEIINIEEAQAKNWNVIEIFKITEYKFNNTSYDLFPEFNSGFEYTYEDIVEGNVTTRTIYNDEMQLPILMRFGEEEYNDKTESLIELIYANTANITDMSYMFSNCSEVTAINVSNWDTSKVTNMKYMFNECYYITQLDVANWDTSNVEDMRYMFYNCFELLSLNISNWDVKNVKYFQYMISNCYILTELDVSGWDVSSAINMDEMFSWNFDLETIIGLDDWDTSNVEIMCYMFRACNGLKTLGDLSNWNTSNVTDMSYMFGGCNQLKTIGNLSNWDTSKVTNMKCMFLSCYVLESLNIANWDTSMVTDMESMFEACKALTNLDLSGWDTSKVINMRWMFGTTSQLGELNINGWDMNEVTNATSILNNSAVEYVQMNNSDYNSVNKIIAQLPERSVETPGILHIIGIDDTSQVDVASATLKRWKLLIKEGLITNIRIKNGTVGKVYIGNRKIKSVNTKGKYL